MYGAFLLLCFDIRMCVEMGLLISLTSCRDSENNQARLVVSLTANDVAFVAFVAFVDLRSRLLLLGKVQTSLTLLSLNRSLAFVA